MNTALGVAMGTESLDNLVQKSSWHPEVSKSISFQFVIRFSNSAMAGLAMLQNVWRRLLRAWHLAQLREANWTFQELRWSWGWPEKGDGAFSKFKTKPCWRWFASVSFHIARLFVMHTCFHSKHHVKITFCFRYWTLTKLWSSKGHQQAIHFCCQVSFRRLLNLPQSLASKERQLGTWTSPKQVIFPRLFRWTSKDQNYEISAFQGCKSEVHWHPIFVYSEGAKIHLSLQTASLRTFPREWLLRFDRWRGGLFGLVLRGACLIGIQVSLPKVFAGLPSVCQAAAFCEAGNEKLMSDVIPTIYVQGEKPAGTLTDQTASDFAESDKRELEIPLHLLQSSSSARMRLSQRKQSSRKNGDKTPSGVTSTDLMASMVNGFTNFANFKFSGEKAESEDEVHNAWGDDDTADDFGKRIHDLEEARGITVGHAASSVRMRRARKNQKKADQASTQQAQTEYIEENKASDFAASDKRELEIPLHLLQSSSSARMRLSQRKQSSRKNGDKTPSGVTSTDLMASMVNGFTNFANFKFSGEKAESEDEVHNAWGDDDTADDFGKRIHDLEEARGITVGHAASSVRMRRARKNQKKRPEEMATMEQAQVATKEDLAPIQHVERSNGQSFAASNVVTSFLNSFATTVPKAEVKTEELEASVAQQSCSMAVPMSASQSLGRARYAKKKGKLDPSGGSTGRMSPSASVGVGSSCSSRSLLSDTSALSSLGRRRRANPPGFSTAFSDAFNFGESSHGSSFFAAATSSLLEFQKLFQTEEEESYSIWGPDDTPEQYQQRLNALERAHAEPSASVLHHRLMRRRQKKRQVNKSTEDARSIWRKHETFETLT